MDEFQASAITLKIPEPLLDPERILMAIRQSKLEKKRSIIKLCEDSIIDFDQSDQFLSELKRNLQGEIKILNADTERIKKDVFMKEHEESLLRNQISLLKGELSKPTDIPLDEDLNSLIAKVCSAREDIEKKKKDVKQEIEKFKKGIHFYKKYLQCTVFCLTKDTLIFTFNPTVKSPSEAREYIKFTTDDNGVTFQYVEMRPKLKNENQLVKRFNECGDVQEFVVSFWKSIKTTNSRKVLHDKN